MLKHRKEANDRAKVLLAYAGCDSKSNAELATCAQASDKLVISAQAYLSTASKFNRLTQSFVTTLFPPVIDGESLAESPLHSLKHGTFKKCAILTGFTTDEGSMFVAYSSTKSSKLAEINEKPIMNHTHLVDYLSQYFAYYPTYPETSNKLFINSVLHEYTKIVDSRVDDALIEKENYFYKLSKIVGDQMVKCPTYEFIDLIGMYFLLCYA